MNHRNTPPNLPPTPSPWRPVAKNAWLLMVLVGVLALLPGFGFLMWVVGPPILLVTFIQGIIVMSKVAEHETGKTYPPEEALSLHNRDWTHSADAVPFTLWTAGRSQHYAGTAAGSPRRRALVSQWDICLEFEYLSAPHAVMMRDRHVLSDGVLEILADDAEAIDAEEQSSEQLALPLTDGERAASWRSLSNLHPGNRFRLMFGQPLLSEELRLTTNQLTTNQLTTNQPTTNQLTTNQPTTNQPTTNQPTTNQPTTNQPTTNQPTTNQLTTNQLTTNQLTKNQHDVQN